MNITDLIDSLRDDLAGAAEIGDERAATVARRLADTLSVSLRLRILDVLGQAALELSSKLPSGHVEVRLAGQDPELVYVDEQRDTGGTVGEDLTARITLRVPEGLKSAVETAAAREGVSVNTWLVRAIARATESRPISIGKRLTGYAQS
jgi:predicted HicB family RNase H-like nuclease